MPRFFDRLPQPEPSTLFGFAGNRISRMSEHRTPDSVAAALSDAAAGVYLFRADKALIKAGGDPLFTVAEALALGASRADAILLGWAAGDARGGGPRLAAAIPESQPVDETQITLVDLRSLAISGAVTGEHLGAIAQGRSLVSWHARHGFCANCGTATTISAGGYRRDCPNCGVQHFPRTDPVVIMLAIHSGHSGGAGDGERVLLGRQPQFAPGMYSCLAGFLEPGETIEDAVRRETHEEAGIRIGRVAYHASQPWPFPSSLMIGCHAEAISSEIVRDEAELEDCRWFSRDEVRAILSGTHAEGLKAPLAMAIAHRLIAAWAEG
jgi:NAD+ diphosphatase